MTLARHIASTLVCLLLLVCAGAASAQQTRFAVIGDYGFAGTPEADVAALVKSWSPEFIITTGDNNYDNGAAATIDANIGQYYHDFIFPYTGAYGDGAAENRFFPCLGNHDWVATGALPYLTYFTLPGNERYFDFVRGPVHFYSLDVDPHEPDGIDSSSVQAQWLKARLATSTERWKIVYMHHSPYSSCSRHGSYPVLQWPYERWGASAVFSGHDHTYERISRGGIPYFVNGLGGKSIYSFGTPVPGSEFRYNGNYGAMRVEADNDSIVFAFIARDGSLVDRYPVYRKDTATVSVEANWNLVSVPMETGTRAVKELFPGAVSPAFVFLKTGFATIDSVDPGMGFWLKFPSASALAIAGDTLWNITVPVHDGWNLIGGLTFPALVATIVPNGGCSIGSPFYGYNGYGYYLADTLEPGTAYWVRINGDGAISLTAQ